MTTMSALNSNGKTPTIIFSKTNDLNALRPALTVLTENITITHTALKQILSIPTL